MDGRSIGQTRVCLIVARHFAKLQTTGGLLKTNNIKNTHSQMPVHCSH